MFNRHDVTRNEMMLHGSLARCGYDWWWHSFTAQDAETGADLPFFVEYFIINPALGGDTPVLGQSKENRDAGLRPSYVMVKAGCWGEHACQLHRFYAINDVQIRAKAPYELKMEDCYASEKRITGKICISEEAQKRHPEWMCDAGEMEWDLEVEKQIAFNVGYGASKPLREAEAFAMYWHAEGMKSAFKGTITCNGRKYTVTPEKSFGYADKNWGRDFTSPWVWLSSNCLKSRMTGKKLMNSVFGIGGGRPKIYFVPLDRRLLSAFYYEGKEYDFNFSHVWMRVKTRFSFKEDEERVYWHVRQENRHAVMDTRIVCRKADMLLVNYEAPDGSKKHNRLWNGGNGIGLIRLYDKTPYGLLLVDEIEATHIGCEYGEYSDPLG
ncbi:MAG: hypothetical protein IJJ13_04875 [Lachnospiraceae bacterium]|nr:hypothetical protein [Lachnospiraceae bacterium]